MKEKTNPSGGKNINRVYDMSPKEEGKQKWRSTLTGDRGTDIETVGFGLRVWVNSETGEIEVLKSKICLTTKADNVEIPNSLPNSLQGENILQTLDVK